MKSTWLFGPVLIFCMLFLTVEPCHAQQYSPEFQALLNQVQQAYLTPKGDNLSSLRNKYPTVVATLIGHALRQQTIHVQQNPSLNNRFMSLQQEAQAYIGEVARTTSARVQDGSRFTSEGLWYVVNRALQGQDDGWVLQNFGVRTGTMPSVLAARSGHQPPRRPLGDLLEKPEETNQVELLGKVAPSVKGPDNCDNAAFYFSDQCKGYREQKEAKVAAERQKSKALNPDGIIGNWSGNLGRTQLRIWKQGDLYLGMMSGKSDGFQYCFKPNEVCLRLKSAGAGPNGPIFKGQYLRSGAADGSLGWGETTFYYHFSLGKELLGNDANYYNGKGMGCAGTCFKR
jgi:hypothetical protein